MWPALQATKELGGSATVCEMNERAIAAAGVTEEQQAVPHGDDGRMSEVEYRLYWARTHLQGIGALDTSARGVWVVTDRGRSISEPEMRATNKAWQDSLQELGIRRRDSHAMQILEHPLAPLKRKRRWLSHVWTFAKTAGPAVASIFALLISGLTYWDTHQADNAAALNRQAAALALQQTYAEKISYWLTGNGNDQKIMVQNLSNSPISNVTVAVVSVSAEAPHTRFPLLKSGHYAFVTLRTVPPCSVITASFLEDARLELVGYSPYLYGNKARQATPGEAAIPGIPPPPSLAAARRIVSQLDRVKQVRG
jgi:hypothetical protein